MTRNFSTHIKYLLGRYSTLVLRCSSCPHTLFLQAESHIYIVLQVLEKSQHGPKKLDSLYQHVLCSGGSPGGFLRYPNWLIEIL